MVLLRGRVSVPGEMLTATRSSATTPDQCHPRADGMPWSSSPEVRASIPGYKARRANSASRLTQVGSGRALRILNTACRSALCKAALGLDDAASKGLLLIAVG